MISSNEMFDEPETYEKLYMYYTIFKEQLPQTDFVISNMRRFT